MQNDREKYLVIAECYRKSRREIDKLKEALGKQSEASREFDRENQDVFDLVKKNRQRIAISQVTRRDR